ncbi:MAG: histidine kinase [Burkholderiales bacterium]|nr:histidine kinase [Burkholderiales bacterium]
MTIDWVGKLQNLLHTIAFCLAIATLRYAFTPDRPYAPPVAHSLAIGIVIWAVIDLGRHFFASARETGWPVGIPGVLLVAGGIVAGYFIGSTIGDTLCRAFGWYGAFAPETGQHADLRASVVITALAGIAGSYYFYAKNKGAYLERKMGEARQHANESRLKLLETQLEPHMLFNTLANLRVLIGVDPARAQTMLDHMIAYLRATLNASRAANHALQLEFDRLRDYLELMAIRMGPRLQFTLDLPAELAQHKVPALLLQPLVENSIQHGLEPKVTGGTIAVSARAEGGSLVLTVEDTGTGLPVIPAEAGTQSFGLTQIRERLATAYGDAASLDISSTDPQGTRATIRLPL